MSTPTSTTTTKPAPGLTVQTHVKARALTANHNQTLVRVQESAPGLTVQTHVKAGSQGTQHNQTLVPVPRPAPSLKVKTHVKAGLFPPGPTCS